MSYRLLSRGNDGINKYKIVIELGLDLSGKRRRLTRSVTCTSAEVKKKEAELKSQYYHTGKKVQTKLNNYTFSQMSEYFLKELCEVKPITRKKYRKLLERINIEIGNKKIKELTPVILHNMYKKLRVGKKKVELSGNTMNEYYKIINLVLNEAVNYQFIESNPNLRVKKPKIQKSTPNFYDLEQVNKLLNCLENESIKWKTIITLAIVSGCRRGELCSLKWENVDFENKSLTVSNSLKVVDGEVYEDGPKTDNAYRNIRLNDTMIDILNEYKEWQDYDKKTVGKKWQNCGYLFTSKYGANMHPDSFNTMLSRIVKKNNLDHISFHGLRHTSCSILVNKHINLKTITDRMGHSKVLFMLDRYAHSFDEEDIASAQAFNDILNISNI